MSILSKVLRSSEASRRTSELHSEAATAPPPRISLSPFGRDPDPASSGQAPGVPEGASHFDSEEAWVMHLLPDDTGASAIWGAQRLEDGHAIIVEREGC